MNKKTGTDKIQTTAIPDDGAGVGMTAATLLVIGLISAVCLGPASELGGVIAGVGWTGCTVAPARIIQAGID